MAKKKVEILTTGKGRLSMPHLFHKFTYPDSDTPIYDTQFMIPKTDKATIKKLQIAVKKEENRLFPNGRPPKFIYPLRDGVKVAKENNLDVNIFGPYVLFKAKSHWKPTIVGPNPKIELTDENLMYSGCNAKLAMVCKGYDNASKGVGFYVQLVQVLPGGDSIIAKPKGEDFFDEEEDFGNEDLSGELDLLDEESGTDELDEEGEIEYNF